MNMKTNLTYDMYVPTRVMFGAGMLNKLDEQPMPGKRALIVISNGKSTRANGYLSRTEEQLHKAGVDTFLFDGVLPNPTVGNVNAGAKAAREHSARGRLFGSAVKNRIPPITNRFLATKPLINCW